VTLDPTILAIPLFLVSMAIEAYVLHREGRPYDAKDTAASLSGGVGNLVVDLLTKPFYFAALYLAYEHRVFTMGASVAAIALLVVAEDFTYYVYHRSSHEIRLFWATHIAHHSSQRYTLGTALRQSWTEPFAHLLFVLPLAFLGFRPEYIAVASSVSLLYQYWIHTETISTLGPFEWIMNTPSHHRVHHGSNDEYIDRNHGGIFIVWDRLFGTFEPERAKVVYGLTTNLTTFNPFVIQTHELVAIFRDVRNAKSAREVLRALFYMPPRPSGPSRPNELGLDSITRG